MTIAELIARLHELPQDWQVEATKSGRSIWVAEPGKWRAGRRYGYVFTDGSPNRLMTDRTGS